MNSSSVWLVNTVDQFRHCMRWVKVLNKLFSKTETCLFESHCPLEFTRKTLPSNGMFKMFPETMIRDTKLHFSILDVEYLDILFPVFHHKGSCFLRTDQLDGETDWKLRLPVACTQRLPTAAVSLVHDSFLLKVIKEHWSEYNVICNIEMM